MTKLVKFEIDYGEPTGIAVSINPEHVAAVKQSADNEDVSTIRLKDGKEYTVIGSHDDVVRRLGLGEE